MKIRANYAYEVCRNAHFRLKLVMLGTALMLSACAVLDKPVQPAVYDFGPGALTTSVSTSSKSRTLMLAEVDAPTALDNTGVMYRLAYADDQQLRPYALARWSMPPAQLVRQRLRDRLSQSGVVLNASDGVGLGKTDAGWPLLLRLELEEFSQRFDSPQTSTGLVKLRAVLVETSAGTEKLLGQRVFVTQRPSASADAAGGVRAMTAAIDALAGEIDEWVKAWR
jgi:cholesterol transport system auxiliary component